MSARSLLFRNKSIKCSDRLKESLKDFDYRQHKLFAFSRTKIVYYSLAEEKDFFDKLLKNKRISRKNPFLIYSLSKITTDTGMIERELIQCIKYLEKECPDMIPSWYEAEKEKLSPIWQRQNLEFPSLDTLK